MFSTAINEADREEFGGGGDLAKGEWARVAQCRQLWYKSTTDGPLGDVVLSSYRKVFDRGGGILQGDKGQGWCNAHSTCTSLSSTGHREKSP